MRKSMRKSTKLLRTGKMEKSPNKGSFSFLGEDGMNDEAITTILRYMDECLFELEDTWPIDGFEKRSYSRWAATEIIAALLNRPLDWAWGVIDEFIIEMLYFAHLTKENNRKFIFAIEVAEEIQALLN